MDPSARDISIKKKRAAQIWPPGILTEAQNNKTGGLILYLETTSGYTMNARPLPGDTISDTS